MSGPIPLPPAVAPAGLFSLAPVSYSLSGGLLRFAHHPHCDRHQHHLIWVSGRPLCLGCTSMAIGIPLGLAAAVSIPWAALSLPAWIAVHALLVAPTALQPLVQKKPFKIAARVALGAASASYLLSGLVLHSYFANAWLWRSSVLLAFAAGFAALYAWRQQRINDPCKGCPQGVFPTCNWNMPRLLAANGHNPLWLKIAEDLSRREPETHPGDKLPPSA